MNIYNWGENEPIIAPAADGGDRTNVFATKVKALFASLFSKLNSDFDEVANTYLPRSGGTMTGDIKTHALVPTDAASYDLGSQAKPFKAGHVLSLDVQSEAGKTAFTIDGTGILPTTGGTMNIGSASVPVGEVNANKIVTGEATITKIITTGGVSGNASSATRLQTARAINGTAFDGSNSITTNTWGTSRNMYVQDASGSNVGVATAVNGSGEVRLKMPSTIKANLVGNVTGNLNGTAETAKTVTGQWSGQKIAFDAVTVGGAQKVRMYVGSNPVGDVTTSNELPSFKGEIETSLAQKSMQPNFSTPTKFGSSFVAPSNGIVFVSLSYGSCSINGISVVNGNLVDFCSKHERDVYTIPVSKGDRIACTGLLDGKFIASK